MTVCPTLLWSLFIPTSISSLKAGTAMGRPRWSKFHSKLIPKKAIQSWIWPYLVVRAIEHWDDNIKLVLDNFACIDDKLMLSRTNGKDIKTKIIYIDTLCTRKIASDTFETVKKQARNNVTLQISRTEIEWNSALAQTQGERTIALKSNQDTYNFMNCHRNTWDQAFFSHLPNISNSVKFAAHLFQLYWRQILANMHPIIFRNLNAGVAFSMICN